VWKVFFKGFSDPSKKVEIFNLGNNDKVDVLTIARMVCDCMGLDKVKLVTTSGVDGGRGWMGDVKKMHLDISKMQKKGWTPKISSLEAVKLVTNELINRFMK